ncbi:MAG: hypothetical protein KGZ86_02265 [Candidatus Latescibacteria bacterium]|nr:hypothetical protein [Candidatus Latescibacterota bacterium]
MKIQRLIRFSLISVFISMSFIFGQSFFSMKGFGEEILFTDGYAAGLGGLTSLSNENPAFPLILNKTEFRATVLGNFVYGQQAGQARMAQSIRPLTVNGKFPLPYKFSFGFRLSELFNQNFDVYSDSIQVANYWTRRHIIGKGGIYGLSAQVGKHLFDDKLSFGFEYTKIIGQELEQWNFEVFQGSYLTSDTVEILYSAHRLGAGLVTHLSYFTIGLRFEDFLPGTIDQKVISHNSIVDSASGIKLNLPNSIGLGLSFDKITQTILYADLFYRNWSTTTLNDTVITQYVNSMKISLGAEYYLKENLPLRLGIRYYQSYLADITGKNITEYAFTMGSRIPIVNFGGFDYSLELIQRQGRELKETIARLNFSLAYEEAWKKRTRRWGY